MSRRSAVGGRRSAETMSFGAPARSAQADFAGAIYGCPQPGVKTPGGSGTATTLTPRPPLPIRGAGLSPLRAIIFSDKGG